MSPLTFGYLLPTQEATGQRSSRIHDLIHLGVEAERLGFDMVWLPDSPFQYGLPDPLLVIASLAALTSRILLAPGVLVAALRHAPLLAQQLASLDALTAGRLQPGSVSGSVHRRASGSSRTRACRSRAASPASKSRSR